ncbi:AbgT family transporter [Bermanella marisrubri]|uniref:Efflux pump component MtrF n=1 Tax=Bermanella marisrubri TaxID=207949 RepID=Q1N341_9GAMM|nr:AbgT family transporter [Bermanella marisrubri]EAT12750.1 efflux pump component MtrF [Oceanobacter sp. RED65] [Bermanella marisrubri]QIZ85134.1 AbgT family transporter [Bermanella marisrubri]
MNVQRWLFSIERKASVIPHPMALFIYLLLIVLILSAVGQAFNWQAQHPSDLKVLAVNSLISADGLRFILSSLVDNFMSFAPVGPVVIMALAFSLAERSGLLRTLIMKLNQGAGHASMSWAIAFLGVMSSIAVDSGYVVLLPLCAALFYAQGRHPLAGLALGFACVSGGFSANLLVGPVDAMLSGISTEAVALVANKEVSILGNYYFMLVSVPLIVATAVLVNRWWVEPYLSANKGSLIRVGEQDDVSTHAGTLGRGFWVALVLIMATWLALTVPDGAVLRDPQTGSLKQGPFMASLVAMIALSVALLASVFGIQQGMFRSWSTWVKALEQGIKDIAPYLVLMFVVAQFIAWFKWSGLGPVLAVHLAKTLEAWQLNAALSMAFLMIFAAILNLFIGSASAKWGLLAPILVPAFYILGIEPEVVQGAYRVADSSTNIITPLMPYFPLVLAYGQKYQSDLSVGRLLTLMLPYAFTFLLIWGGLLTLWVAFGWPLGPSQ